MTHALEKRSDYWERLGNAAEQIGMPPPLALRAMRWKRRVRVSQQRQDELNARLLDAMIPYVIVWVMGQDRNKGEA